MGMANGSAADQPSGSTRLKRPSALTYLLSAGVGGGAAVADAGGVAPPERAPMRAGERRDRGRVSACTAHSAVSDRAPSPSRTFNQMSAELERSRAYRLMIIS